MNPLNETRNTTVLAAIQMVSSPSVEENLAVAARLIGEAALGGARLVLLPEYFCILGRHESDKVAVRETFGDGPIQRFLAGTAARHGIWLIGGTVPLAAPAPDKVLNTTLVFGPDGTLAARYDKIHLFAFSRGGESYDESRTIAPGETVTSFEGPEGLRVGLSICYDLRFPELYRAMGEVDLVVVPSAFTYTTGAAHWEILLRARAVENQCYVLAAAQGGVHPNKRRTWGHSMLIDPWGEIKAVLPEGEGVVSGTLDPAYLQSVRRNLPALSHRILNTEFAS
jgi:predicted amidohydrolase